MARWLIKSDPEDYSAANLERDGRTLWTGVRNPTAQRHLRGMVKGDDLLVYHTGDERAVVAIARVEANPIPDPTDKSGKSVAVEIAFVRWLKAPVALADIKADPELADMPLVRIGRLSVMPVSADEWKKLAPGR